MDYFKLQKIDDVSNFILFFNKSYFAKLKQHAQFESTYHAQNISHPQNRFS